MNQKPEWISKMPDTSKRAYSEFIQTIKPDQTVPTYWRWVEETVGEYLKSQPKAEEAGA